MTAISQAVSAALLHFVWQGTAVAFLLWIALLLLRNRQPGARYAASCAALTLMVALPAATSWILYERPISLSGSIAFVIPAAAHAISASPGEWLASARQWILPLWAVGVGLFAIRLALAWRHVMLLRRAAEAAEGAVREAASSLAQRMSVARPVRVLVSALAEGPSVVGWLRPAILMPAAALAGLDATQLQAILAHELAHIRRHDYLVNMLQTIVETLLFYHPAVWWASSRMRNERELCCDDLAVRHCGDAIGYARALTKLERMRVMPEPAVAATGGALSYRIQRLTGAVRECAPSRLPVLLAVVAVALCVPMTVHRAVAQKQAARTTNILFDLPQGAVLDSMDVQGDSIAVEYPEAAVRQGITGAVLVEATLEGNGRAMDARVVTGPLELRKAALRGVLEGRFANATAGEVRQVTIGFTPEQLAASKARLDKGSVTYSRLGVAIANSQPRSDEGAEAEMRRQDAQTESFLNDELEQARKQLAEAANQPELEAQLKAQIAEQERKLAAAPSAMMLHEQELSAVQRDLELKAEEANLAAAEAARDLEHDQRKAGAMNVLLDSLQRQLANKELVYTNIHPEVRALKAKIAELQQAIIKFVAGRKLVRIDGDQLPPGFHLPVQVGDTLTEDSLNSVVAAVDGLAANFEVAFFPVNEREAAIRIVMRP
jgi:beta-lactamase regulating signal transducer with metallopeptidase domain